MLVALAVAVTIPLLLPRRFTLGPRWLIPAIELLLAVALVIADPGRIDRGRLLSVSSPGRSC